MEVYYCLWDSINYDVTYMARITISDVVTNIIVYRCPMNGSTEIIGRIRHFERWTFKQCTDYSVSSINRSIGMISTYQSIIHTLNKENKGIVNKMIDSVLAHKCIGMTARWLIICHEFETVTKGAEGYSVKHDHTILRLLREKVAERAL